MISRRVLLASAATPLFAARAFAAVQDSAGPPTVKELVVEPTLRDVSISPDGRRIAVLHRGLDKGRWISYLLIHATNQPQTKPTFVHLAEHDVKSVKWGANDRLLLWVLVHKGADGQEIGFRYFGEFIPTPSLRMLALGPDGEDSVLLFGQQPDLLKSNYSLGDVTDVLLDDPDHVLMQAWDSKRGCEVLHRMNIRTGVGTEVEQGVHDTNGWITQNGAPVLRYDSALWGNVKVYARAPGEKEWKFFRKFRRNEVQKVVGLEVVGSTPEPGVMLIAQTPENENFQVVRKLDLKTLQIGEVFARAIDADLTEVFCDPRSNPLATSRIDDTLKFTFLEAVKNDRYQKVAATFGGDCNVRPLDISLDGRYLVIGVTGPRRPGEYLSLDFETGALKSLGEAKPWLRAARLAPTAPLPVKTRSGQTLTSYLTTPLAASDGPRPLVVMPHGGPESRDSIDYDMFVQALAAYGWMVLQPTFRGSDGYGRAFADAGRRHWGDLMQEDIEDAVDELIKLGRADPKRIAICGASYGGYAALMGAVRRPDFYRAVVSIAGLSDLPELIAATRRDSGADSPTYAYVLRTIGDPKTDRAMLEAASPVRHAETFKAPVLLIHGTEDKIAPTKQSEAMHRALVKAGRTSQYVELKGFGHQGWDEATWTKVMESSISHIRTVFASA